MQSASKHTKIVALITKVKTPDAAYDSDWLHKALVTLMRSAGGSPGFWSAEIIAPDGIQNLSWTLIHRFADAEAANAWSSSTIRKQLLEEISTRKDAGAFSITEEIMEADGSHGMVASAIVTHIKPGMEKEFFDWESRIQTTQSKYPGYRGVCWQPPPPGCPGKWSTLLRFDTPEHMENWYESDERKKLLEEQDDIIHHSQWQRVTTSFPGWFPVDAETGAQTPKWKTAMLLVFALFPVVVLQLGFVTPLLGSINRVYVTFFNLLCSIGVTTFVSLPALISVFRWWLMPAKAAPKSVHLKGTIILIVLWLMEVEILLVSMPDHR